jgi:hypothetical protein
MSRPGSPRLTFHHMGAFPLTDVEGTVVRRAGVGTCRHARWRPIGNRPQRQAAPQGQEATIVFGQISICPPRSFFAYQESCHHRRGPEPASAAATTLIDRDGQEGRIFDPDRAGPCGQRGRDLWWSGPATDGTRTQSALPHSWAKGYGNAICAPASSPAMTRSHMVGDHSRFRRHRALGAPAGGVSRAAECSVSGVQPARSLLPRFGTVAGRRVPGRSDSTARYRDREADS